jgi:hypothetical protein
VALTHFRNNHGRLCIDFRGGVAAQSGIARPRPFLCVDSRGVGANTIDVQAADAAPAVLAGGTIGAGDGETLIVAGGRRIG